MYIKTQDYKRAGKKSPAFQEKKPKEKGCFPFRLSGFPLREKLK